MNQDTNLTEQLPELPKDYEALTATQLAYKRTQFSTLRTGFSTQRTALSFQRTRLSADRTLMSVMRTALSLIGFGFTIFQFFHRLRDMAGPQARTDRSPRYVGLSLVFLGIGLLVVGIVYHVQLMRQVRTQRDWVNEQAKLPEGDSFPVSMSLVTAIILLIIGIFAIISMFAQGTPE